MDHLLLPEGAQQFIKVLYKAKQCEFYDDDDFMDYPKRKGWSEQDLLGINDFGGRSDEEVENFFQTWLFFGFAIEILKAAGLTVTTEDFLAPEPTESPRVVTTQKIPSLLVEWKRLWPLPEGVSPECTCKSWIDPNQNRCRAETCWKNFRHARDSLAWRKTLQVLDRACVFVDRYCTRSRNHQSSEQSTRNWPVSDEISTSIIALGYTLRRAAIAIYDIPRMRNEWGTATSSLLRERLSGKWCKSSDSSIPQT